MPSSSWPAHKAHCTDQFCAMVQINKPVLNYLDATDERVDAAGFSACTAAVHKWACDFNTHIHVVSGSYSDSHVLLVADTLEADSSTATIKKMYTQQIQYQAKLAFNNLRKDHADVLLNMFQHSNALVGSSEASKSVMGSILRQLFLDRVNVQLDRAVWGLQTKLDAAFRPFASKQQVLSQPLNSRVHNCTAKRGNGRHGQSLVTLSRQGSCVHAKLDCGARHSIVNAIVGDCIWWSCNHSVMCERKMLVSLCSQQQPNLLQFAFLLCMCRRCSTYKTWWISSTLKTLKML